MATWNAKRTFDRRIKRAADRNVQSLNLLVSNEITDRSRSISNNESDFDGHISTFVDTDHEGLEHEDNSQLMSVEGNEFESDVTEFGGFGRRRSSSVDSNDEPLESLDWDDNVNDVFFVSDDSDVFLVETPLSFREQLASWAVLPGVFHVHVNKLLAILKTHPCHSDLPSDVRSLLKTPRKIAIKKMPPGEYFSFGVLAGLRTVLSFISFPPATESESIYIEIAINVDGLPIFSNSSNKQLWVILGLVRNVKGVEKIPFIIAIYFGLEKPVGGPNTFLQGMVDELKILIDDGFSFAGHQFKISRIIFVCDSPARAFITGVKYHSGYSSCPKCVTVGETAVSANEIRRLIAPKGRRVFPCTAAARRTNESFRERHDEDHHNYYSCIEELPIVDMVLDVPVDPMHLVDEGAAKKLFLTYMEDSDFKISPYNVRRVNEDMTALAEFTPRDFARRSRPYSRNFKCTEWSQAIRYTGPVVFRNRLSPERYAHLLTLHIAVKILSSERFCVRYNDYAKSLLNVFVQNAALLYGKAFISFNIHNLVHLADDVMMFGPLNCFSAYVFENKLGIIKRLLRKSEKPLQQIVKRLAELEENGSHAANCGKPIFRFRSEHRDGPLPASLINCNKQFRIVDYGNFTLTIKSGDNCVLLDEKIVVIIENIVEVSCKPMLIGRSFRSLKNLYPHPFDSTDFDIFQCSELSGELQYWPIELILFKMYLMPLPGLDSYAAYPLENL